MGKETETHFCTGKVGATWLWEGTFSIKKKLSRGKKLILRLTRLKDWNFKPTFVVMPWLQRLRYHIMSSKVTHEFLKQKEVAGTKGNLSYCSCLNPEHSLSQPVSNTILHVGLNGRPGRGTGCFFFSC